VTCPSAVADYVCDYTRLGDTPPGQIGIGQDAWGGLRIQIKESVGAIPTDLALMLNYSNTAEFAFDMAWMLPQYRGKVIDRLKSYYDVDPKDAEQMVAIWMKFDKDQAAPRLKKAGIQPGNKIKDFRLAATEIQMWLLDDPGFQATYMDLTKQGVVLAMKAVAMSTGLARGEMRDLLGNIGAKRASDIVGKALDPVKATLKEMKSKGIKPSVSPGLDVYASKGERSTQDKPGSSAQGTTAAAAQSSAGAQGAEAKERKEPVLRGTDLEMRRAKEIWNVYTKIVIQVINELLSDPYTRGIGLGLRDEAESYAMEFNDTDAMNALSLKQAPGTAVMALQGADRATWGASR
jgi:hypothetical protein